MSEDTCVLLVNPSGRFVAVPKGDENRLLNEAPNVINSGGQTVRQGFRPATSEERQAWVAQRAADRSARLTDIVKADAEKNKHSIAMAREMARLANGSSNEEVEALKARIAELEAEKKPASRGK
ncbi:MAG: hypothetical protein KDB07_13195 [Planctomycetes bacterium]|nr:hypothetical protein [Planctomycetota bacterium]